MTTNKNDGPKLDIKKRGLGRGLDALFRDVKTDNDQRTNTNTSARANASPPVTADTNDAPQKIKRADEIVAAAMQSSTSSNAGAPRKLPIGKLTPGKFQPRTHFNEEALDALADSIKAHGVLQPLLVRPLPDGTYEIIAGERRWRAAQKARLHELPVVVQEFSDKDTLEIALIENLQREDLSAVEEAEGYQRLMDEFEHTQEMLSKQLGKSRSHVANMLRLLKLPKPVLDMIQRGKLSAGHARALINAKNPEYLAVVVVNNGLSVRQTEKLAQKSAEANKQMAAGKGLDSKKTKHYVQKDVDIMALETRMTTLLGMKTLIEGTGAEGKLVIEYKSLDQLDDVLKRLMVKPSKGG